MRVLVTGATGFTGSHVVPRLVAAGLQVRALLRDPARVGALGGLKVEWVAGDLADQAALARAMTGCDALLNIASLGFGHAPGIIAAAEASGLGRAVFVSTTAIFTQLNAGSKIVRVAAEQAVRGSRLDWVIVRPTMIFGSSRDRNMCRLVRFLRRSPVLPVFGPGLCLMQPVYVEDLADALVAALITPSAGRREYNVSGRDALPYNEIVHRTARAMGRRVKLLHLPFRPVVRILEFLERRKCRLPLKAEQVLRLNEDKAFSWAQAGRDLAYSPRSFDIAIRRQLSEMGLRVSPLS